MKFVQWWSDQPPFNQIGMSFVAGVAVFAVLSLLDAKKRKPDEICSRSAPGLPPHRPLPSRTLALTKGSKAPRIRLTSPAIEQSGEPRDAPAG